MLKIGDKIPLELGGAARITAVLGSGGQGTVCLLSTSDAADD